MTLGTGQTLATGRRVDADIVFVHDQAAEEKFVAEGFGLKRLPVMYNDFVLIGPVDDPAEARGKDITAALGKIGTAGAPFVSRGDKSGTHAAELRYWKAAGTDIAAAKPASFKECGCGMGPALSIAAPTGAYMLADRGARLNFKNRADLAVLVEGDTRLFNQYGVMVVNPGKHPHVKMALAQGFANWVVSPAGQASIAGFKFGGEQLFFPNAGKWHGAPPAPHWRTGLQPLQSRYPWSTGAQASARMPNPHSFEPGGFSFLEGGFPYSAGVVAWPGFEIRRVRFSQLQPMAAGFARIAAILQAQGRPTTALCAAELRSPQPFTMAGFQSFNRDYVDVLGQWGLVRDGLNPVARSNVCPLHAAPAEPGFHAFCYTVPTGAAPAAAQPATFVVAGSGEWPEHLPFPDGIVARGDISPAGMAAKIAYVLQTMRSRCDGLGADWASVSAAHVYTGHDIHPFLASHFAASGLLRNGLDWQVCAPPILELEFEMDVRRITHETLD